MSILLVYFCFLISGHQVLLPFNCSNRKDISRIQLTEIGKFGLTRKVKNNNPQHCHTGIDIKRPNNNYQSEPVFAITEGTVISKRTDGAFANLIIEHRIKGLPVWTVYEHIAGIRVKVNDKVNPYIPIARFMNKNELDRLGWQFNHFHLEILKIRPKEIKPDKSNPERFFNSYTLECYTTKELDHYFFDPIAFLKNNLQ